MTTLFEDTATPAAGGVIYRSHRATLYLADNATVLPELPDGLAGLTVTDPPYGKKWRSGRRAKRFDTFDGDTPADRPTVAACLAQCIRLTAQRRHLYVFGPADILAGQRVSRPVELIWDKTMMGNAGNGDTAALWGPAHEPITFAVGLHMHPGETDSTTTPARMRRGTVLRYTRPAGLAVRHPSEKPVGLLRELIESSSRPGDLVLDPYAGVGSTGVAAVLLGRRALLVESDIGYAYEAARRLAAAEALADAAEGL